MHCIQHQASAKGGGLQTSTAFMEKKLPLWKKITQAGGACSAAQTRGVGAIPVQRQGGKGALHAEGAHIQLQEFLWWESSQLLSCREEAAAHRSQQLEEGQGVRRLFSMDRSL